MKPLFEPLEHRRLFATFLVTNVLESGFGSFRQAILSANGSIGSDEIRFQIGDGVQVIRPGITFGGLPVITDSVTIDATAPAEFPGQIIQLSGENAGGGADGIRVAASDTTVRGLTISRFSDDGVEVTAGNNVMIVGCKVGTDVSGTLDEGNANQGFEISGGTGIVIGGTNPADRNLISGNDANGVHVTGGTVWIMGNYIGTQSSGLAALPNNNDGVQVQNNAGVTIGGTSPSVRNVISGNGDDGVEIQGALSNGNIIEGNYIGLNADGSGLLGNTSDGVELEGAVNTRVGGTAVGSGNYIAGNNSDGIEVSFTSATGAGGTGNQILGNFIGIRANNAPGGNAMNGVDFRSGSANFVGDGTAAGANQIANNTLAGVLVETPAFANRINGNSLRDNGGLGIDLAQGLVTGVTPNDPGDADTGANNLQNFPEINAAAGTSVTVSLQSTPNSQFTIQVYGSSAADPSGFGEGATFLGSAVLTTDQNGVGTTSVPVAALPGGVVTATATDAAGNTSEFSSAFSVSGGDVTPPTIALSEFLFQTLPLQLHFRFSEQVNPAILNANSLTIVNRAGGDPITPTGRQIDPDGAGVLFNLPGQLPDGNYRATLSAASVRDLAGNALPADHTFDFFAFAGDANHDRSINISDFSRLASNFNRPGTFSDGDFNYSGTVEIGDFSILASKFNTNLPAPRPALVQAPRTYMGADERFSNRFIDDWDRSLDQIAG